MRKFKLINNLNQEYDLMHPFHFFNVPSGLGYNQNIETARVGSAYIEIDTYLNQNQVDGSMVFNDYVEYQNFVRFASLEPLKLAYAPLGNDDWYYLYSKIKRLGKTELTTARRLECPISFVGFGTWFHIYEVPIGLAIAGSKTYDYEYDYFYVDTVAGQAQFLNIQTESTCKIELYGQCVNPSWSLSQNGVVVMNGMVSDTIASDEKLVINSYPQEMEIAVYDRTTNAFKRNDYSLSDFTKPRFVLIPSGNSVLTCVDGSSNTIGGRVEVYENAKSI